MWTIRTADTPSCVVLYMSSRSISKHFMHPKYVLSIRTSASTGIYFPARHDQWTNFWIHMCTHVLCVHVPLNHSDRVQMPAWQLLLIRDGMIWRNTHLPRLTMHWSEPHWDVICCGTLTSIPDTFLKTNTLQYYPLMCWCSIIYHRKPKIPIPQGVISKWYAIYYDLLTAWSYATSF